MEKGKKTAIVSNYYFHNYGSQLQACATQMALDKLGVENETVDVSGFYGEIRRAKAEYFLKASLTSGILFTKAGMVRNALIRRFSRNEYAEELKVWNKKFDEFSEQNFRLSAPCSSKAELGRKCMEMYSAVMVGSDQLWLPGNIAGDYFTLNFVPDSVNTIAYATSFGQASLPRDSARKASAFLKKIRHIGVREKSGQRLVWKLTGRRVPVVCDPTLLFTGEEWMALQQKDPIIHGKYIFYYYLEGTPLHRDFVRRLKAALGYKVVVLHPDEYVKDDETYADEVPYDMGPSEYLNLIRNAQYVCTDSFHCTAFAILYNRPFFTFRRFSEKNRYSTNTRLDTLLHLFGIEERLVTGEENTQECLELSFDFQKVSRRLEKVRERSYEYLRNALEDVNTDL